jgi:AraC-like DNA-binding protein
MNSTVSLASTDFTRASREDCSTVPAVPPLVPIRSWRAAEFGGLDLLHGSFTTHAFARHTHETYSIGLLQHGSMTYECRGATHTLHPGTVGLIQPDEAHTGHADGADGWTYRNLYPEAAALERILEEIGRRPTSLPRLPTVMHDAPLAEALIAAHTAFEQSASSLARESLLHRALTALLVRHAMQPPALPNVGREASALEKVRAILEDEFAGNVTLDELARVAGLNAFTLLRAFRRAHGLPPHAYQVQVRLRHAKRLLRQGETPAQTALNVGFADQSHFGRHFRRAFGITPQQYRQGVTRGAESREP